MALCGVARGRPTLAPRPPKPFRRLLGWDFPEVFGSFFVVFGPKTTKNHPKNGFLMCFSWFRRVMTAFGSGGFLSGF